MFEKVIRLPLNLFQWRSHMPLHTCSLRDEKPAGLIGTSDQTELILVQPVFRHNLGI
jgi:hypothetical protein